MLGPGVDPDADELPELIAVPPTEDPIPGDTNGDGNVDFSDFLALSANFGNEVKGGTASGDFNENGVVEFDDFLQLSGNYGTQAVDAVFASMVGVPSGTTQIVPHTEIFHNASTGRGTVDAANSTNLDSGTTAEIPGPDIGFIEIRV